MNESSYTEHGVKDYGTYGYKATCMEVEGYYEDFKVPVFTGWKLTDIVTASIGL